MTRTRFMRLQTLMNMALRGCTYDEILNKALSWGITEPTARGYMKTLKAMLTEKSVNLSESKLKGKPNPYNSEEEIIGSGADIIKVDHKEEKHVPIWLRGSSLLD